MKAQFKKLRDDARIPERAHPTDVGLDLWATHEIEVLSVDQFIEGSALGLNLLTNMPHLVKLGTGLSVKPPPGFHFEIYIRSSSPPKRGWTLANGAGIIDPNYRGELQVVLERTRGSEPADELEFPCKIAQLILRKTYNEFEVEEVEELDETDRGEGGFGSSGL